MSSFFQESCRQKDQSEIGSWSRLCVTSDGCWQTRGFHSANGSFIIVDYLTQAILWRGHLSQRGSNEETLYAGTSKSMEANLALTLYGKAKEEGATIEVVWQDDDSSSASAVREIFPGLDLMKCGGHVGRAGNNRLTSFASMKEFTAHMKSTYRKKYPEVNSFFIRIESLNFQLFSFLGNIICSLSDHEN